MSLLNGSSAGLDGDGEHVVLNGVAEVDEAHAESVAGRSRGRRGQTPYRGEGGRALPICCEPRDRLASRHDRLRRDRELPRLAVAARGGAPPGGPRADPA